jgi:hypothetical protein
MLPKFSGHSPYTIESVTEIRNTAREKRLEVRVLELKNAEGAQNAPSHYGVFSLLYDGKLLADCYISKSRLLNILNKELPQRTPHKTAYPQLLPAAETPDMLANSNTSLGLFHRAKSYPNCYITTALLPDWSGSGKPRYHCLSMATEKNTKPKSISFVIQMKYHE